MLDLTLGLGTQMIGAFLVIALGGLLGKMMD